MAKELGVVQSSDKAKKARSKSLERKSDVERRKSVASRVIDSGRVIRKAYDDFGGTERVGWMLNEFSNSPLADQALRSLDKRYPGSSRFAKEAMSAASFLSGEYKRRNKAVEDGVTYIMGPYGDQRDKDRAEATSQFQVIESVPDGMLRREVENGPAGKKLGLLKDVAKEAIAVAAGELGGENAHDLVKDYMNKWPQRGVSQEAKKHVLDDAMVIDHDEDEAVGIDVTDGADGEGNTTGTEVAVYDPIGDRDFSLSHKDETMLSLDAVQILKMEQAYKRYCDAHDIEYEAFVKDFAEGTLDVSEVDQWVSENPPKGHDAESYEAMQFQTDGLTAGSVSGLQDSLNGSKIVLNDRDFANNRKHREILDAIIERQGGTGERENAAPQTGGANGPGGPGGPKGPNKLGGPDDPEAGDDDKRFYREFEKSDDPQKAMEKLRDKRRREEKKIVDGYARSLGAENPYLSNASADDIVKGAAGKNDDMSQLLMMSCMTPLANGVNAKSLAQAISAFAVMVMLSPKMREGVTSTVKNLDETMGKAFKDKRDKVAKYLGNEDFFKSRDARKVAKANAQRVTNTMSNNFAQFAKTHKGNMPYVTETAAVTMVKLTENAHAAMKFNAGNPAEIERISDLHGQVMKTMSKRFEKSGLDMRDVKARARDIVGEKIAENPAYASVFRETSNGAVRMSERKNPQKVEGSAYAHQGWDGKWDVGNKTLSDEADFFNPRPPMESTDHQTNLAAAIATDIGRNPTPEGMRDVFVGYLGGWEMQDTDLRRVAGEGTDRDTRIASAMTARSQIQAMSDDGVTHQAQEMIMRDAFADATAYIEETNPELFQKFKENYGMDWPENVESWRKEHEQAVSSGKLKGPVWVGANRMRETVQDGRVRTEELSHGDVLPPSFGHGDVLSSSQSKPSADYAPKKKATTQQREGRQGYQGQQAGRQRSRTRNRQPRQRQQQGQGQQAGQQQGQQQQDQAQQGQGQQVDQQGQRGQQSQHTGGDVPPMRQRTRRKNAEMREDVAATEKSDAVPTATGTDKEEVLRQTKAKVDAETRRNRARRRKERERLAMQREQMASESVVQGGVFAHSTDAGENRNDTRDADAVESRTEAGGAQFINEGSLVNEPDYKESPAEAARARENANSYDDPSTPGIIEQKGDSASRGKSHVRSTGDLNMAHNYVDEVDHNDTVVDRMNRLREQERRKMERNRQRERSQRGHDIDK